MSDKNIIARLYDSIQSHLDDLVYGKDEDIFVRHARDKSLERDYGDIRVTCWIPGLYAYVGMKKTLRNPNLTAKEKASRCAIDASIEIGLNVWRAGCIYGSYSFLMYLHHLGDRILQ